jgi:exopolysaccharide biosynthesis polyprenyl glycosylphosphotransferase
MYHIQVQLFISMLMLAEALVVAAGTFLAAALCRVLAPSAHPMPASLLLGIAIYMALVCNFFLLKFSLYSERRHSSLRLSLLKLASAVALSMSILGLTLYALSINQVSNLFLFAYASCLLLTLALVRVLVDYVLTHSLIARLHSRRVLIVGSDRRADLISKLLGQQRSWGHRLVGFVTATPDTPSVIYGLPRLGSLPDMQDILAREVIDEVFFVLPDNSHNIHPHLAACERLGITYRIVPVLYDPTEPHKLKVEVVQDVPTLAKIMVPFNPSGYIYKRIMDYAMGLVGCGVLLLMYPLTALAIKLDSPGPVLFTQLRVGRHGRVFTMYKFRTMCVDAEKQQDSLLSANEMNGAMFKLREDPRITRVGRILRRASLDEFPQFVNVLKGEMSIVGTRPPTVEEVEKYTPAQRRRLSIRPGITGLWQVSGRNRIHDFAKVVELDLAYIDNWRFWTDVRILVKTLYAVLRGSGAR